MVRVSVTNVDKKIKRFLLIIININNNIHFYQAIKNERIYFLSYLVFPYLIYIRKNVILSEEPFEC